MNRRVGAWSADLQIGPFGARRATPNRSSACVERWLSGGWCSEGSGKGVSRLSWLHDSHGRDAGETPVPRRWELLKFPAVNGVFTQTLLDTEQLIVFGDPVGATEGAGFDLAGVGGHRDVGDGRVFGFTGPMADDGRVTILLCEFDGIERLAEGADLVDLHQNRVGRAGFDALAEKLHVRDEQIVAHKLDFVAQFIRQ